MKRFKVFDSKGYFLRQFPTYKQAFTWVYSRGAIGRWKIQEY